MDIYPDPDTDKEQKADLSLCIICQEKNDEDLVNIIQDFKTVKLGL